MYRKELLKNIEDLGITENQLRKYVQHGLLKTMRTSQGPGKVNAIYPEDTINILEEIQKLQKKYALKDILFILFFKGTHVNYKKVQQRLREYYNGFLSDFKWIENHTNDPVEKIYYIETFVERIMPKKKPGAPSLEEKKLEREKFNELLKKVESSLSFIIEISKYGTITSQSIKSNIQTLGLDVHCEDNNFDSFVQWVDVEKWLHLLEDSSESTFKEISTIFRLILYYSKAFNEVSTDSIIGNLILHAHKINDQINTNPFLENPLFIKVYIFIFLNPSLRKSVLNFLTQNGQFQTYDDICSFIPNLVASLKGGEINE
jgi:DNA-binding transcriptional MerR regulator